jgi:hypothetical protein
MSRIKPASSGSSSITSTRACSGAPGSGKAAGTVSASGVPLIGRLRRKARAALGR